MKKKYLSSLSQQVAPETVLNADLFSPPRGLGGRKIRPPLGSCSRRQSVTFSSLLEMDVGADDGDEADDAGENNWEEKDDHLPEGDFPPAAESSSDDDELEETPVSPAGFAKVPRRVLRMNEVLWASHGAAEAGLSEEVLLVPLQRTELQDKLQRTETMMHAVAKTLFAKVTVGLGEGASAADPAAQTVEGGTRHQPVSGAAPSVPSSSGASSDDARVGTEGVARGGRGGNEGTSSGGASDSAANKAAGLLPAWRNVVFSRGKASEKQAARVFERVPTIQFVHARATRRYRSKLVPASIPSLLEADASLRTTDMPILTEYPEGKSGYLAKLHSTFQGKREKPIGWLSCVLRFDHLPRYIVTEYDVPPLLWQESYLQCAHMLRHTSCYEQRLELQVGRWP